jgi:alkylhydroperoxidase/carboxymuconolactone decarboxylase family protein YurZ
MGITTRLIDAAERKFGEKLDYLRDIASASPAAFYKFALFLAFARHRKAAPLDAYYLASIGALLSEDCGPCLQIAVNQALAQGVNPTVISAALAGGASLDADHKLYLDFGRAVSANVPEAEDLRLKLAEKLSPAAMVDLAIAIAGARVFPALKRGLGHAKSCSLVQIKVPGLAPKNARFTDSPLLGESESMKFG